MAAVDLIAAIVWIVMDLRISSRFALEDAITAMPAPAKVTLEVERTPNTMSDDYCFLTLGKNLIAGLSVII